MSPSLLDIIAAPREWARQVGTGSTVVVTGPCRVFSAVHTDNTLSATPNPEGRVYNNTSAAGDALKFREGYGSYFYAWNQPGQKFGRAGLRFSVGLTIQVVGGGTLIVSYLEE
jgi:hypothetical protein